MYKPFEDVATFMEAAGQTTKEKNETQAELYYKLIQEEVSELETSKTIDDKAEVIDACFDTIWVIVGYLHSLGYDIDAIWNEGAQSNLIKINKETGQVVKRDDGKILKPEGWRPPNFSQFVK